MPDFSNAIPMQGFVGGIMIGIASAIMLLGAGRIAGISGLLTRSAGMGPSGTPWKIATGFIGSLLVGA